MTNNEIIKEARKLAKEAGLTFKVDNSCTLNGGTLYKITNRRTGILHENWDAMPLMSAYETLLAM